MTSKQIVKLGYRQTEVGIIPEDWNCEKLGILFELKSGSTPRRSNSKNFYGKIPWVTSTDLNREIIVDTLEKISLDAVKRTNLEIFPKNTFVIALYGLEAEGTRGKCGLLGIDATINQACMAFVKLGDVELEYLFYFYLLNGNKIALKFAQGTKQQNLYGHSLKTILISYPKEPEQRQIIEVLSDIINLIKKLDYLITKKKNIKQGAMQELLTGKRRLEGFNEDWKMTPLRNIFDISAGGDHDKNFFSPYEDETYRFPIYSNALTNNGVYGYSSSYQHEHDAITVTARGTIGVANTRNHNFCAIGRLLVLKPTQKINCFFVSQYVNSQIKFPVESTGVPQLTAPQISKYSVNLPKYEEQSAIAKILLDMDTEIKELKKKRDKYVMIKEGMMQKLLTGEIRVK